MKFMAIILAGLFSTSGFAQIYFGTSHQYTEAKIFKKIDDNFYNNILTRDPDAGYLQCQKDHSLILDIVKEKNKEHIGRILVQINELTKNKEFKGSAKRLIKNLLLVKLVNYMILSEMKKELNSKSIKKAVWDAYDKDPKTNTKIFEMKYSGIDVEGYFNKALDSAAKHKAKNSIPNWLLEEIKSSLITDILEQLGKNSFKVIVNGVAIQFASKMIAGAISKEALKTGLKKSIISFSGNILASVGKGLIIELLTIPLKGNRLPPETLWLDLLNDYPGIIVNPELMSSAGINDGDWNTHCNTLNRRAHSVEMVLTKLGKSMDKEFFSTQKFLSETLDFSRTGYREEMKPKIDNTFVARKPMMKLR